MSNTEHEVKVKISAEVREFQNSMKEARAAAEDFQKRQARFKKAGQSVHKDMGGLHKELQKQHKKHGKEAINHERQLQAAIKRTVADMREKLKVFKGNVDAIKEETKALNELEDKLANVSKYRKAMGIRTWGEKATSAGEKIRDKARQGLRGAGKVMMAAGGIGLGFMLSQIAQAYQAKMQAGAASGGLVGLGSARGYQPGRGQRFGYDIATTHHQAAAAARATGSIRSVNTLQAASRLGLEDAGSYMHAIREGGAKFTGTSKGSGEKELQKIIALGMESGIERARLAENIGGVITLLDRQRGISAGDVSGTGFAAFAAMLGRSGLSGFQGTAGANLMSKLDAGIRAPGGGDSGQALILQSLGFGKPGGGTSYYDALKMQEQGLSDPGMFGRAMSEVTAQFGAGEERNLALKNLFGVSLDQAEQLSALYDQGKMGDAELEKLRQIANGSKTIEEQALEEMRSGFGHDIKLIAGLQNRLVGMGEKIAPAIQSMQRDINSLVTDSWPLVVGALNKIAEGVHWIVEKLKTMYGANPSDVVREQSQKTRAVMANASQASLADLFEAGASAKQRADAYTTVAGRVRTAVSAEERTLAAEAEAERRSIRTAYTQRGQLGAQRLSGFSHEALNPRVQAALTQSLNKVQAGERLPAGAASTRAVEALSAPDFHTNLQLQAQLVEAIQQMNNNLSRVVQQGQATGAAANAGPPPPRTVGRR